MIDDNLKNEMKEEKIIAEIEDILINVVKVNPRLVCADNYDQPFTGRVFQLLGRDLLYIFYEVEKRFGISIDVNTILNYEFNSINGIKQCVKRC